MPVTGAVREVETTARAGDRSSDLEPAEDVRLESVSKRFGEMWALRPTNLTVKRGEFFSLLGASGSGKTTTLRIIAGFEQPTSGSVYLGGRDTTWNPPYERPVNTVFQDYALFPHMTVEQNVGYGLRVRREAKAEIQRRVVESLELVQLLGYERRRPSQLSGGQRQRVALARALINVPRVLLLDEPLGALDLKLRREMQTELKRIQSEVGITFLYVTHDQDEAMSMSDRVAVMSEGRIVQIGAPSEVYERPTNAFIAGFVGTSNVLQGEVAGQTGTVVEVSVPGLGRVLCHSDHPVQPHDTVVLTIRPEKISFHDLAFACQAENMFSVRVAGQSYGGAFTRYDVVTGDAQLIVVEQNVGNGPSRSVGEEVRIAWTAEAAHVLAGEMSDVNKGSQEGSQA